jgi:phenylpropionate dioxygenase-like ring-hydroxylating dioxygenase large terminal subunit
MLGSPCNHGSLQELHCIERCGLVWVSLAKERPPFDDSLTDILSGLEVYRFEEFSPVEARDFVFPVNWKIVLENALDFYHVAFAHSSTVSAHVQNAPTFERLGPHNVQSLFIAPYPWRSWIDSKTARGGPYSQKQKQSLHKYFLFPNLVLNVLPYHITIMQVWPIDRQSCWMRYRFCIRKGAGLLERARVYGTWLASRWILYEDVRLYDGIQRGMNRSPFDKQPLHSEEGAIQHFHEQLTSILGPDS